MQVSSCALVLHASDWEYFCFAVHTLAEGCFLHRMVSLNVLTLQANDQLLMSLSGCVM